MWKNGAKRGKLSANHNVFKGLHCLVPYNHWDLFGLSFRFIRKFRASAHLCSPSNLMMWLVPRLMRYRNDKAEQYFARQQTSVDSHVVAMYERVVPISAQA
jgi:hypothetical protein